MQDFKVKYYKNIEVNEEAIALCEGEIAAKLLAIRGYDTTQKIKEFFREKELVEEDLRGILPLYPAAQRINYHLENNHKIMIYGDYDVDGVTATTLLKQVLDEFSKEILYHVPDRFKEGYGMNREVIENAAISGVKLIITCDCGINNLDEINCALELGMEVIVTDHHSLPDILPPAHYILNPKLLPEKHKAAFISGCGMAYFLAKELLDLRKHYMEEALLLDLVAMSTIADVVRLENQNRTFLKKGIKYVINPERMGLKVLTDVVGKGRKLKDEEEIAFQLCPRINAAGRLHNASLAVELLLCQDYEKAVKLAQKLEELNGLRRELQESIVEEAELKAESIEKDVIILYNPSWHQGVLGIAAGKIAEKYHKPTLLFSKNIEKNILVGSARSIEEVDIYELIKECSSYLSKFGGHREAAGLSLEEANYSIFRDSMERAAYAKNIQSSRKMLYADLMLEAHELNLDTYASVGRLGPFGAGFEAPTFYGEGFLVVQEKTFKEKHTEYTLEKDNMRIRAIKWNDVYLGLLGKTVTVVYKLTSWNFKHSEELQLQLINISVMSHIPSYSFDGEIFDYRDVELSLIKKHFEEGVVYAEGLLLPKGVCYNRYNLPKAKTLILYSIPPTSQILRELLLKSEAQQLVLAYKKIISTYSELIKGCIGILKKAININNNYILMDKLCALLGEEEGVVFAVLRYLEHRGFIQMELLKDNNLLFVEEGTGRENPLLPGSSSAMKKAIEHSLSFKGYLTRAGLSSIRELVSGA